jgi:hypothetical protein
MAIPSLSLRQSITPFLPFAVDNRVLAKASIWLLTKLMGSRDIVQDTEGMYSGMPTRSDSVE